MAATPEYTKRAVDKYRNKFDLIQLRLEKGTKEKILELTGEKCNDYISRLVYQDLERLEQQCITSIPLQAEVVPEPEPTPEPVPKIDKAAETIEELNARLMAEREKRGIKNQEVTEKDLEPPKKRKPLPWQDIPRGIMSEYLEQKLD